MLHFKRIEKLTRLLSSNGLDAIFAGPSPTLNISRISGFSTMKGPRDS